MNARPAARCRSSASRTSSKASTAPRLGASGRWRNDPNQDTGELDERPWVWSVECHLLDPLTLFVTALGSAAGRAAAGEATKALREVAGLQEAQIAMTQKLDAKVDALVSGPFNTGQRQLRDAAVPGRDPDDRRLLLKEARSSFTAALGQDRDPLRRSFAALSLAAVWLGLGSPDDVGRTLAEAHGEALRATAAEMIGRAGVMIDLALEVGRASPRVRHKRARETLGPYANQIAAARRSWGSLPSAAPRIVGLTRVQGSAERHVVEYRRDDRDPTAVSILFGDLEFQQQVVELDAQLVRGELIDIERLPVWLRAGGDAVVP